MPRQRAEVQIQQARDEVIIRRDLLIPHRTVGLRIHQRLLSKIAVIAVVALIALLRWDAGAAFFLALLAASATRLVDRRVSVSLGLLSLAICPLLLIANREAWLQQSSLVNYYFANMGLYNTALAADTVTIWAYYFLCIGVVAQILHYLVTKGKNKSE